MVGAGVADVDRVDLGGGEHVGPRVTRDQLLAAAARGEQVAQGRSKPAERLARRGRLGRRVIDTEIAESGYNRPRAEEILHGEPHVVAVALSGGDHRDRGALPATVLLVEHRACDRPGVAQRPREHRRPARRRSHRDRCARLPREIGERGGVAAGRGIRHRRRQAQYVDHHHDIGRREAGEARHPPLDTHLIAGLIGGGRHPASVCRPARTATRVTLGACACC